MLSKTIIYCSELLMTTIVKLWLQSIRRIHLTHPLSASLHSEKNYIYVSNHSSYLDPLVMWSVLDIQQRLNGAPTKVMTAPHVFYSLMRPFIWCLGAFPAKSQPGSVSHAGVEGALHFMRAGYNVCIFPEGRRSTEQHHHAFQGVSRILAGSDDCDMILIHIIWGPGPWWKRSLELRAAHAPTLINRHDPNAIMDAIYAL